MLRFRRKRPPGTPSPKASAALGRFQLRYLLAPVIVGVGLAVFLIQRELTSHDLTLEALWQRLPHDGRTAGWFGFAVLMAWLRDGAYVIQLRELADRRLGWIACLQIILVWDFSAAVSPTMIGGAPLALYMLTREGLALGRSIAIVFTTVFFDQVFYLAIPPLTTWAVGQDAVIEPLRGLNSAWAGTGLIAAFWSAFGGMAAYVGFLAFALFLAPVWTNRQLKHLLRRRPFKRWRRRGWRMSTDLALASTDLRSRPQGFWWRLWAVTALAWFGRYMALNSVLAALSARTMDWPSHVTAFARQAGLYVLMVIAPTPGGTGVAEAGFGWLFHDMLPDGLSMIGALAWRLVSYYPYLIVGIPALGWWLKRHPIAPKERT